MTDEQVAKLIAALRPRDPSFLERYAIQIFLAGIAGIYVLGQTLGDQRGNTDVVAQRIESLQNEMDRNRTEQRDNYNSLKNEITTLNTELQNFRMRGDRWTKDDHGAYSQMVNAQQAAQDATINRLDNDVDDVKSKMQRMEYLLTDMSKQDN